ncbi:MAG: MATE family efflux transporter [Oscillospiraceae bacterium]
MNTTLNDNKKQYNTILAIAGPVFLEQVMVTLVQYVDTAMVGSLGATATASIAINTSSIDLVNGIMMAIGIGITALMARAFGSGEKETAQKYTRQVLSLSLVIGIITTILMCVLSPHIPVWLGAADDILDNAKAYLTIISAAYLFRTITILFTAVYRSFGDTKTPLKINILSNIINVIGNVILIYPTRSILFFGKELTIYGAGMGVAGAALSTSFATVVGAVITLLLVFNQNSYLPLKLSDNFSFDKKLLGKIFKISLPTALERGVMSTALIVMTWLITQLGTLPLAAHHIALTAEALFFMPGFAFSVAGTTLVGQAIGSKDTNLAFNLSQKTLKISIFIMCFAGVALYFMDNFLVSLFSNDPYVLEKGAYCLRLYAIIQPIQVVSTAITGCLRGAGDTKTPFYILSCSMISIRIIGSLIGVLVFGFNVEWVWQMICLDIVVRCVFFLIRFYKKSWLYTKI